MLELKTVMAVAGGSALGGLLRWWLGAKLSGSIMSAATTTLCINIIGSLAIGLASAALAGSGKDREIWMRDFLMIGVLGGFTTFSAFSLQTLELYREGLFLQAAFNVAGSMILPLAAVTAGFFLGRIFFK